ncbi:MAG: hypothetical protein RIR48_3600 [Bacteroidota bacterium]|jgi:ERCC4-related helicase
MDFNLILSLSGTIASLVGAWIAIREASKAKSIKKEIVSIKKDLNNKLKSKELNDLLSDAKRIRTILLNYKIQIDIESEGIDINSNIKDINHFVSKLNDNGNEIKKIEGISNDYEELVKNLNKLTKENIFKMAKSIYANLNNFIPRLNDDLNSKIFDN